MKALQYANWVLAFTLELWMLWAYSQWSYRASSVPFLRWAFALAAPIAAGVLWGMWAAPKAAHRLASPWLFIFESAMFALAGAAIYGVGRPRLALAYLIMAGVSVGLGAYFHDANVSSP